MLNCSDGYGYGGREHSSNEVTQYVYVRDEGWVSLFLAIRAPTRSHQTFHLLHRSHCCDCRSTCHKFLPSDLGACCDMDAISCRRRCPIHFDLTADDSEEECLLVARQMASRSGATYSATLSRSECRWPTRRRVTCLTVLAEEQHFPGPGFA